MSDHRVVPPDNNSSSTPSIQMLQEAVKDIFSQPDFLDIYRAGIFGSFAKGTAKQRSDVDVVVIAGPEDPSLPPNAPLLHEALPPIWRRRVDVVLLEKGQDELWGYIQLEALLSCQTIYLRDDQARAELMRVRRLASTILDDGHRLYANILGRIDEVRKVSAGISWEGFLKLPQTEREDAFHQVHSILVLLDIQPQNHPMHEAFWLIFLESSDEIRQRLDPYTRESRGTDIDLDEQALGTLWAALTSPKSDGLEYLARMMREFVLPSLEGTFKLRASVGDIVEI